MRFWPLWLLVDAQKNHGTYDYVVVGAGAAGGVLAAELASRGFQTLLLEAGPEYNSTNVTTPALHVRASEDPAISWDFQVEHYEGEHRPRLYPRASGVGGCTLHNAMIHMLPHASDFDRMVEVTNDTNWSRENILRYYTAITRAPEPEKPKQAGILGMTLAGFKDLAVYATPRNVRGWLRLTRLNVANLLAKDKKLRDVVLCILGVPVLKNLMGYDVNYWTSTKKMGVDEEENFLVPVNGDPTRGLRRTGVLELLQSTRASGNLTIMTDALATEVLLDKTNTAYGVKFLQGSHLYRASKAQASHLQTPGVVFAAREVIVSAGTFNTPQLLMLSGVGDAAHLRRFGIRPKVNLPGVGRNLHDRYEVSVNLRFQDAFAILEQCTFTGDRTDPCFAMFEDYQAGPYTFSGILSAVSRKSKPTLVSPDLIILIAPIYFTGYHTGMGDEIVANKDVLSFLILKAHSFNRAGYVKLRSRDPRDTPEINFRYFEDRAQDDIPALIAAINEVRTFAKTFHEKPSEIFPGPALQTDQQLESYVRTSSWGHHATGTMKMGPPDDAMAVLDGQFRVRHTQRLRVVDMSIFPDIPGYFPVLYLYLVANKAADDIVNDAALYGADEVPPSSKYPFTSPAFKLERLPKVHSKVAFKSTSEKYSAKSQPAPDANSP